VIPTVQAFNAGDTEQMRRSPEWLPAFGAATDGVSAATATTGCAISPMERDFYVRLTPWAGEVHEKIPMHRWGRRRICGR